MLSYVLVEVIVLILLDCVLRVERDLLIFADAVLADLLILQALLSELLDPLRQLVRIP